mgnify:CR=1 FL=1
MVAINAAHFEALSSQLDALGAVGPLCFCLFLIIAGMIPVPGFGALVVASGFLFGFPHGFMLVYPSAVVGSVLGFALGRRLPAKLRALM